MVSGETRRLWIPAELATMPGQPVQIDGTVVYDVQLVRIEREPQTPEDLTAPPSEAKRSGPSLASLVLIEGWGDENPTDGDRLLIHYSKWKPNGTLVRSTISRGKPESFEFDELEPAWVVPLSSMVEGEQRRIWISSAATAKEGPRVREIVEIELLRLQ